MPQRDARQPAEHPARRQRRSRGSFTLIELLVVVAIIILMLAVVGPAVTSMWAQRLESQAEITLAGAIRSVQMQARTYGERGLFFFVDAKGTQRIAIIVPANVVQDASGDPVTAMRVVADCFQVAEGTVFRVPPPYRVAPRRAALTYTGDFRAPWSDRELNVETLYDAVAVRTNERHRNFFTLMFGADGRLRVGRTVLIRDSDIAPTDGRGDRTGLIVAVVDKYYDAGPSGTPPDFPGTPTPRLAGMVVEAPGGTANGRAINFPGVDGLILYDDSVYDEMPAAVDGMSADAPPDRRDYLANSGFPYYVSPTTGELIRGRSGE